MGPEKEEVQNRIRKVFARRKTDSEDACDQIAAEIVWDEIEKYEKLREELMQAQANLQRSLEENQQLRKKARLPHLL